MSAVQSLLELACNWLEGTIKPSTLHEFARRQLLRLQNRCLGKDLDSASISADLEAVAALMHSQAVPWMPGLQTSHVGAGSVRNDDALFEAAEGWLRRQPDMRCIQKGEVTIGSGRMLEVLDASGAGTLQPEVDENLERLLRHVEVERRGALTGYRNSKIDSTAVWMQRHDVSILFSRLARRRHDIRFLNAALKLNDWAYWSHRRRFVPARNARYVLAIFEQETSFLNWMYPCVSQSLPQSKTVSTRAS